METFTFNYKTKVEQFQEQFPELYQEIYNLGFTDGRHYEDNSIEYDELDNDPSYYEPEYATWKRLHRLLGPEYAKPLDDSKRYCLWDSWELVYKKAKMLETEGYTAGNRDWKNFMQSYKTWKQLMYITWNPTHKLFAVEFKPY